MEKKKQVDVISGNIKTESLNRTTQWQWHNDFTSSDIMVYVLLPKKVMNIAERICKCPITFKYETGQIYLKYLIALEIVGIYGEIS